MKAQSTLVFSRRNALLMAAGSLLVAGPLAGTPAIAAGELANKKIAYIMGAKLNFYWSIACGVRKAVAADGLAYQEEAPDSFAPSQQIPIVDAVVATKPDVLLISPNDSKALVQPLRNAANKGIRVITVANSLAETDFVTSQVYSNSEKNGATSADLLAKLIGDKGGKVVFLSYQPGGSAIVDARRRGFEEKIKTYSNLEYLGAQIVGASYDDGARVANAVLSAHPDIAGAVGSFQFAHVSMALSLRERGLAGKVKLVSSDAGPEDVKQFRLGNTQAIIADDQFGIGENAVLQAVNAMTGKPVEKTVETDVRYFTSQSDPDLDKYTYTAACPAGR